MKKICCFLSSVILLACSYAVVGCTPKEKTAQEVWDSYWESETEYGMKVDDEGTLLLMGQPYYGFGVNYFSMFSYTYSPLDPGYDLSNAKKGIDQLAQYDIPIARINIGGYGASNSNDASAYDWVERYLTDKENWTNALEEIADYCQSKKIGLIFSYFWKLTSIPYHFGENCADLGDTSSQSFQFVETYTREITEHFKEHKAVLGWELGNEWNLETDLAYVDTNNPEYKTFKNMRAEDYVVVANKFDEIVTSIDPYGRFISSGNAIQRNGQYNISNGVSKNDSWDEHKQAMQLYHPNNFNMVSDHIYDYPGVRSYNMTLKKYLTSSVKAAKEMNKVYFLGEFCLNITGTYPIFVPSELHDKFEAGMMTLDWTMAHMEDACNTIIDCRVQLTLFWNFDPQDMTEASFCLENVQGTVNGAYHTKFGKFILGLCQKLNAENYPNALKG